jgi:hypothetical protein
MSVSQHEKFRTTESESEGTDTSSTETKPGKLDLSLSQVMGGALAAMTAAALGSRLSVAGTIIGAAVASVVAAVGGAVYTASLRHTQAKVRTAWIGRWNDTPTSVEVVRDHVEASADAAPARRTAPLGGDALIRSGLRLPWKTALVGALVAFGVAVAVLTGLELVSGHALSGGEGTTLSQVGNQDQHRRPAPPTRAGKSEPSTTNNQTPAATSEPTAGAERTESTTPDPQPTSTSEPSSQASNPSSPRPSTVPTASGTPAG